MELTEKDRLYIAHTYHRYPIIVDHGKGAIVYDVQGKGYLDFTSGIGVNLFGHSDPGWKQVVMNQLNKITHVSNLYYSETVIQVAEQLVLKSGCKKVFFANSGAESNEGAIKAARKYSHDRYGEGRDQILTLTHSFHGRTITTLAACAQDVFHRHYMPFTPGFQYVNTNDTEDLSAKVNDHICAILLEVVQGEGGVLALEPTFLSQIQQLCDAKDILLIIDEVQTGIGRCGSLFAYERYGLHPDIVTCAKALGGGLPIGAVLLFDKVSDVFQAGDHGTTFGGNPLACAGAAYVLSQCNENLYQSVRAKGAYLKKRLNECKALHSVTGLGLMVGASLTAANARQVVEACLKQGLLILTAKDRLRFLPPLNIRIDQLDHGLATLFKVLNHW